MEFRDDELSYINIHEEELNTLDIVDIINNIQSYEYLSSWSKNRLILLLTFLKSPDILEIICYDEYIALNIDWIGVNLPYLEKIRYKGFYDIKTEDDMKNIFIENNIYNLGKGLLTEILYNISVHDERSK